MNLKLAMMIGLSCLSSLGVPHASSQVLLAQAFLNGGQGANVITNSLNLAFGVTPGHDDPPVSLLFRGLWVHHADVGHIYTMTPADDYADFRAYTHALTDGSVSFLCDTASMGSGSGSRSGIPETHYFSSLPPGNNGTDFAGFEIDYYTLVFNTLDFVSPGTDPNGDGLWTDCTYSATFSVYGLQIPEPMPVTLLCLGIGMLCAKGRCAKEPRTNTDGHG
jgi:hypothetical protein